MPAPPALLNPLFVTPFLQAVDKPTLSRQIALLYLLIGLALPAPPGINKKARHTSAGHQPQNSNYRENLLCSRRLRGLPFTR